MSLFQEFRHLRTCGVLTRKNGEDWLLALLHLLVEHIVSLVKLRQSGGTIDNSNSIDILELLFTIVDSDTQMLWCSCGEDIDGIGYRRTREKFTLKFIGLRTFYLGNNQSTLR